MSKKIFFSTFLVVVSAIVFSACLPGKQERAEVENRKQEQTKNMDSNGSFSGSLKELVGFGKAQKCTWEEGDNGMSGITYTDGKHSYSEVNNVMVADFNGEGNNQEKGSMYAIYDGEYLYSWSSASKEGMKMKYDENEEIMKDDSEYEGEEFAYEEEDSEYTKSMETDYEYKCSSWRVDKSKFNLPKDIKFKDLNAMMNSFKEGFGDVSDVCSMLNSEEQEKCITDWVVAEKKMKQMSK